MASPHPAPQGGQDRGTILVVDDDPDVRVLIMRMLTHQGFKVLSAAGGAEARPLIGQADAVFLDVMMPGETGQGVLRHIRATQPHLAVVMVTASQDVGNAVTALKGGAMDYLLKPVRRAALVDAAQLAVQRTRKMRPAVRPSGDVLVDEDAVFAGPSMHSLMRTLEQVSHSAVPVMLLGESGTGKEVMARFLHRRSNRSERPFVALNCAALPRELAESELFGHEPGAFTGSLGRRHGVFEEADDGVLFLDEVGELEPPIQAKLLRILQEREFTRVGGTGTIPFKARIVVATNRDLAEEVGHGRFRMDLFYRLDVISVTVPPLRQRREEIPVLAHHLLERFARVEQVPGCTLAPDAVEALQRHDWPGNVRELENVLKRAALLANGGTIHAESLALDRRERLNAGEDATTPANVRRLSEHEAELMAQALQATGGNVAEAARRLGIGRATFYRRAKRHGLRT